MSVPTSAMWSAWSAPVHVPTIKVEIRWNGTDWVDETARVLSAGGVDSVDAATLGWQSTDVSFVLDNADHRFTSTIPTGPLYAYLSANGQRVRISTGWASESLPVATLYVDTLTPSEAQGTATLRCVDRLGSLANSQVSLTTDTLQLTSEVFRRLCVAAGLTETTDFVVETGDQTCQLLMADHQPLVGELAQVAMAEGGRMFVDTSGVIRFWPGSHWRAARVIPDVTLTRSLHAYDAMINRRRPSDTNRILLTTTQRTYQASGVVCSTSFVCAKWVNTGGTIPTGGATGGAPVQLEAVDPVTFETGAGAVFGTLASISCATTPGGVAGTMINAVPGATQAASNTVYYTWTPGGQTGILHVWSCSETDDIKVSVTINGTLQRISAPLSIVADDPTAQAAAGGVITAATYQCNYLPAVERAADVAKDLLLQITQTYVVEIPAIDGIPFLRPGDCFAWVDDLPSPAATYTCILIRHEWQWSPDAGYTSHLVATSAVGAQAVGAVTAYAIAPTITTNAATPQAPPWYWGSGSAQDGTWDRSEWG